MFLFLLQLHSLLLIISVYFAVVLLAAQIMGLLVALTMCAKMPPGLVFMIACICVITGLASKAICHEDKSVKGKVS